MRHIGSIALEHETRVGDMIYSKTLDSIFVIVGEKESNAKDIVKVFVVSSSKNGLYDHKVPLGRSINYSFITGGCFMTLGKEE
jgi:hypothetical protein